MHSERINCYKELEKITSSSILVYVTGDRQGMETQMHPEVLDIIVEHLDAMNNPEKISLILHSRGGDTSVGWSLCNLIRSFCKNFEVIIPSRAHSAATLLCLGADKIIMTKQATLGPIDPNVNTPLNPMIPGAGPNARVGVSVESIKGFVQLAKEEFSISESADMATILSVLASNVHPLVLGNVFRAKSHIRMLARKLLEIHFSDKQDSQKMDKIIDFLCSESGSHDYTINRTEARDSLGLNIDKPDMDMYNIIKDIYQDIENELELKKKFDPALLISDKERIDYVCSRAIIESVNFGSNIFQTKGYVTKTQIPTPNGMALQIQDYRIDEGWIKNEHK